MIHNNSVKEKYLYIMNDLRNKTLNPPTGSEPAVDNTKSNSNDSKTKEVDKNGRL